MDFFDGLSAKLSQTGKKTKQMANNLMDTAKINSQISEINKNVSELFGQIGVKYYEQFGDDACPELSELCDQVKAKMAELEQAKAELQRLKNVRVCPQCGQENSPEANFCSKCSAPLPELPKQNSVPQETFCPSCGNKLMAGAKFCTKCGAKMG